MEQGYLADTNAIIDYLEDLLPRDAAELLDKSKFQMSVVSRMELLAWPKATPEQLTLLENFVAASNVFPLDEAIILKAIEIRKFDRLKLPDAIVAATAVVHNLKLITRNQSDFKKVASLQSLDPYLL